MSLLVKLVQLYRGLERPEISRSSIIELKDIPLTNEISSQIIQIWSDPDYDGEIVEVSVGLERYNNRNGIDFINNNKNAIARRLTITLSRSSAHQFYTNISDFIIRADSLNNGEMPSDYYIVEGDLLKGGINFHIKKSTNIEKIEHFCKFIQLLKRTCDFEDNRVGELTKAVFVVTDEDSKETLPKTIKLDFTEPLLKLEKLNLNLLEEMFDPKEKHKSEKLNIFRIALWDVMQHTKKEDSDIYFIATHWDDILVNYESSYSLYVRGYSFNKFKKDIDDFCLESISKVNNMINDIALKSLTIPSIFTIWLYVLRSPKFDEVFNLGLALISCFAAIVIIATIDNQQYLLCQLDKSTKRTMNTYRRTPSIFGQYSKKDTSSVDDLLLCSEKSIFNRISQIRRTLIAFRCTVWFFTIAISFITSSLIWPYEFSIWQLLVYLIVTILIIYVVQSILSKKD